MKIDYSPRSAGKTTKLIEWLRKSPDVRYVVTFSFQEESRLARLYPDLAHRIICYERMLVSGSFSGGHSHYAVDNADLLLERVLRHYIDRASITKEVLSLRKDEGNKKKPEAPAVRRR